MSNALTIEQFRRVLPKKMTGSINSALVDRINTTIADPIMLGIYRENLLSYTNVMKDGKFKLPDYLNAVRYVSYKVMGSSNIEAYTKTFPSRFQKFTSNGTSQKDIASYVTAYNKNKLVNLIYEQTFIPTHVMNADIHQKAINTLADLMITANSEKVRSDSATSLLTHLKAPETTKIELDISVKQDSAIDELRATTLALANMQKKMIEDKVMTAQEVAHSKFEIIDPEDAVLV